MTLEPDLVRALPNGLRLVVEAMDAPRVVVEHRVRAGAAHEDEGARGAAHLVEHLLFSDGADAAGFQRFVEDAGGTANAWTGIDRTTYRSSIRPEALDALLVREAARFGPRRFSAQAVAHEVAVTSEERAWRFDTLEGVQRATEQYGQLFPGHPYGRAIVPPVEVNDALDVASAQAFYDRWYRADRMELVVAGPVDAEKVAARVEALFGGLPTGSPADPWPSLASWTMPAQVDGPEAGFVWRTPPRGTVDADALAWIAAVDDDLELLQWDAGGLLFLRTDAVELDFDARTLLWLREADLDAAFDAAPVATWSPVAWVEAWGDAPRPVTFDECHAAWAEWIQSAPATRIAGFL